MITRYRFGAAAEAAFLRSFTNGDRLGPLSRSRPASSRRTRSVGRGRRRRHRASTHLKRPGTTEQRTHVLAIVSPDRRLPGQPTPFPGEPHRMESARSGVDGDRIHPTTENTQSHATRCCHRNRESPKPHPDAAQPTVDTRNRAAPTSSSPRGCSEYRSTGWWMMASRTRPQTAVAPAPADMCGPVARYGKPCAVEETDHREPPTKAPDQGA